VSKEFDNTNRGQIWPRKARDTDEDGKQYPHFTGSLNVGGVEYWVDAWKRKPGADPKSPSLSFKVKQKDGKPAPSPQRQGAGPSAREEMDDEIPF